MWLKARIEEAAHKPHTAGMGLFLWRKWEGKTRLVTLRLQSEKMA